MNNKFDVLIVCFNDDDRLTLTLNSLVNVGFENFVIIQDGSIYGSTKFIVKKYFHKLNIIYKNELDSGLYDAMNKGSFSIVNNFFLTVNCGDLLICKDLPINIEIYDLVFCSVIKNQKFISTVYFPEIKEISRRMAACHQGLLINKFFFQSLSGYDLKYKIAADYDFLSRALIFTNKYCVLRDVKIVEFEGYGGLSDSNRLTLELETAVIRSKYYSKFRFQKNLLIVTHLLRYLKFKLFYERIGFWSRLNIQ